MKELIQKFTEAFGPSGHEERIREVIRGEVEAYADEIRVDAMGNLIVRKAPQAEGPGLRIMLAAHMDEIGVMVTHLDDEGFARFTPIGGVFPNMLLGARVVFANGVQGTFGSEGRALPSKKPRLQEMYLDVGAVDKEDMPVSVGDAAAFEHTFADLGKRLMARNFDDRIGCAVAVQTLRELDSSPHELFFVFTVQEEVGIRGAATSAFGVEPQLALAVDVTATGDTPEARPMAVSLGDGPAIKVKDRGMLTNPRVKDLLVQRAEGAGIPYQMEVLEFGSTDARAMQVTRQGIPAGVVSIPSRYVHTPSQMVDYDDVVNAVRLLVAVFGQPIDLT